MKLGIVVLLCLSAMCLRAQDAKVIALNAQDAATAKRLYAQRAEVDRQIKELEAKIQLTLKGRDGWGSGEFEYDSTFSFVVPRQYRSALPSCYNGWAATLPSCYNGWAATLPSCCNVWTTTPATLPLVVPVAN